MTKSYKYHASRMDDGTALSSGTIDDPLEQGMGLASHTIKAGLIMSHPLADGLTADEIDVQMSLVLPAAEN